MQIYTHTYMNANYELQIHIYSYTPMADPCTYNECNIHICNTFTPQIKGIPSVTNLILHT